MSSLAFCSPHRHHLATARAVLTMNSNGLPFEASITASFRHIGWRKSAREWSSVLIAWNRQLKTDFACIQNPVSSSSASSSSCDIYLAQRISSNMQSASVASHNSKFPIASMRNLSVFTSWLSSFQYQRSWSTVATTAGATSVWLLVHFWASEHKHVCDNGLL